MKSQSPTPSTKPRPNDSLDCIFWMGMDRLRGSCIGVELVEIGTFFPGKTDQLTPREASRAEGMGLKRCKEFTAARVALKRLARRIALADKDMPDASIETLGPDGVRPCLADSDLCCSVSHTRRFAVAVGNARPVGVDIEVVATKTLRIWHLFMAPAYHDFLSKPGMEPERTATRAWTMKEAAAKAFGLDLSEAIREVEVVAVGEQESLLRHRGKTYSVLHAEGQSHVISLLTCDAL